MSVMVSVPDVDYCSQCGMDWHQPRPQGWHYPDCPAYHEATNEPEPEPDEPEVDDGHA